MGIVIPQVVTSDRASGAQVIDGSLNFNQISEPCLTRSLGSSGNRSTWTVSLWAKLTPNATTYNSLFMGTTDGMQWEYETLMYSNGNLYYIDYISQAGGVNVQVRTNDNFRDSGGWYHIVLQKVSNAGGIKLYVNNRLLDSFSSNTNNGGQSSHWNTTGATQSIGNDPGGQSTPNSQMSQFYFTDGLSLGPGYFGYTDPLTGTWRPKKFRAEGTTVNDGTVWSAGAGANFDSSNPATNGFDGNPATYARTDNANVTATVTFSKPIHFANLAVRGALETGGIIKVNGVDVSSQYASGSSTLQTINLTQVNGVSSPLTSISLTGVSGAAQPRFSQIIVDGVAMQDSTTTNLDFGTNGFYLPMDGNSPIGEDKSGKGNNWTPVNFGGSVSLTLSNFKLPSIT